MRGMPMRRSIVSRATQKLWSFCVGSGGHVDMAARTLEWLRQQGELPHWWEEAATRRARG